MIKAANALVDHSAVVIDATFSEHARRDQLKKAAERRGQPVIWIEMTADEETIRERVSQSRKDSEADYEVYQKVAQHYDPLAEGEPHLTLDSGRQSVEEMISEWPFSVWIWKHTGRVSTAGCFVY